MGGQYLAQRGTITITLRNSAQHALARVSIGMVRYGTVRYGMVWYGRPPMKMYEK